jgi:hypothetical protein
VRLQNSCDLIEIVGNGELESVVRYFITGLDQELHHGGVLPIRVTEVCRTVDGCASRCAAVLVLQVEPGAAG